MRRRHPTRGSRSRRTLSPPFTRSRRTLSPPFAPTCIYVAAGRPFKRSYLVVEAGTLSLYRSSNNYHSGGAPHDSYELGGMRGTWLDAVAADASAVAILERAEEM